MLRLPEKVRRTLERLVNGLQMKENVYGIGLFGSWSRGDAASSSDIDLLVLDSTQEAREHVERKVINGLFIDLDFVPKKYLQSMIPPRVDQKLYEMQVLYDRDWTLTNTKILMNKSYSSPERVEIRTEAAVVESDIHLSRATSAFSREDHYSAYIFSTVAFEDILKILAEIALLPISNSRMLEVFEKASAKLGTRGVFEAYLATTRLHEVDTTSVRNKLRLFKTVWEEIRLDIEGLKKPETPSFTTAKSLLDYYLNPAFLQGAIMRTTSLVDSGLLMEATHYMGNMLLDMLESYFWHRSSMDKIHGDPATLFRSLESLETRNPSRFRQVTAFFGLDSIQKADASRAIEQTRKTAIRIRRDRKVLIKNHLIGS